jgi:hypothetical protein
MDNSNAGIEVPIDKSNHLLQKIKRQQPKCINSTTTTPFKIVMSPSNEFGEATPETVLNSSTSSYTSSHNHTTTSSSSSSSLDESGLGWEDPSRTPHRSQYPVTPKNKAVAICPTSPKKNSLPFSKTNKTEKVQNSTTDRQSEQKTVAQEEVEENAALVVYYDADRGGTALFNAIAESDWDTARHILEMHPEQARTWVVSTGTVQTTFDWSIWKRLPLHEASRRQAPIDLVTKLVQEYPQAIHQKTHFQQLPLHLAVESNASADVVHLLLARYFQAIREPDQSGRTPMEILESVEIIDDFEQHALVQKAMQAAVRTWELFQQEKEMALQELEQVHQTGLEALRVQHDEDLQAEQNTQEFILEEVEALRQQLSQTRTRMAETETAWNHVASQNRMLQEQIEMLQQQSQDWQRQYLVQQQIVQRTQQSLQAQQKQNRQLQQKIEQNQSIIEEYEYIQENTVVPQVKAWQSVLQRAMTEMQNLVVALEDQNEPPSEPSTPTSTTTFPASETKEIESVPSPPRTTTSNTAGPPDPVASVISANQSASSWNASHPAEEDDEDVFQDVEDGEGDDDDGLNDDEVIMKAAEAVSSSIIMKDLLRTSAATCTRQKKEDPAESHIMKI